MTAGPVKALSERIAACRVCRDAPFKGDALPHEPRPVVRLSATARVCICGQAPGTRVHKSGVPFTDPSGDRLREWMGVNTDEFYDESRIAIVPMGFCFPGLDSKGGDLPPRRECGATWHEAVFASMPDIELIVAVGQYAHAYHLGAHRRKTLTETVHNWRAIWAAFDRPKIIPLPHPSWRNNAWIKRNPWFSDEILPILRSEVRRLIV